MKRLGVLMARTLAMIELAEINQRGTLYVPQITKALVDRYKFEHFPTEAKHFDLEGGIEFRLGKIGDIAIDRVAIFGGTILLETQVSTETSKELLLNLLNWLRDDFGATFNESQVRRWAHINQLLFQTDFPILAEFSKPLAVLAEKVNATVSEMFGEEMGYESQSIQIGHDPSARKNSIAGLQIYHRGGVPYKDNRYFSEAPLPTEIHWELLEEFEKNVLKERK